MARTLFNAFLSSGARRQTGTRVAVAADGRRVLVEYTLAEDERDPEVIVAEVRPLPDLHDGRAARPLAALLADWRDAERRLAQLPDDDPGRAELEAEVERVRSEYQQAQRRR